MAKKLQSKSQYAKYDINNDGIVSDEEFAHMSEIKRLEQLDKVFTATLFQTLIDEVIV